MVAALVFHLTWVSGAAAESMSEKAVLECYIGQRPEDADHYLQPIRTATIERGFVVDAKPIADAFEQGHSLPGLGVGDDVIARYEDDVADGYATFRKTQWASAIDKLARALRVAELAGLAFVTDPELRAAQRTAIVVQALAYDKSGDHDTGLAVMEGLFRSFPGSATLKRTEYGPDAYTLNQDASKSVSKMKTGDLEVTVNDENVVIFVDWGWAEVAKAKKTGLVPGVHHVLLRKGSGSSAVGRSFLVTVEPGEVATLDVDWPVVSSIHTSERWTGCSFETAQDMEQHLAEVVALYQTTLGLSEVLVLTIGSDKISGRRTVRGILFTESVVRDHGISLEPVEPSVDYLHQLGAYLVGSVDYPPPRDPPSPAVEKRSSSSGGIVRWLPWSLLGTGVLAVITGGALSANVAETPATPRDQCRGRSRNSA